MYFLLELLKPIKNNYSLNIKGTPLEYLEFPVRISPF